MPNFGEEGVLGILSQFDQIIAGSVHTCTLGGIAESITVWTECSGIGVSIKAALYNAARTAVIGSTEEVTCDAENVWKTLNFTGTKPTLAASTDYYIVIWSAGADDVYGRYGVSSGRTITNGGHAYNGWPDDISGDWSQADRAYSIYCTYSLVGQFMTPRKYW